MDEYKELKEIRRVHDELSRSLAELVDLLLNLVENMYQHT